jgi:hypothetical protein
MARALQMVGLLLDGAHHRGLDDGGVPPCDYGQRAIPCISINRNRRPSWLLPPL